MIVFVSLLVSAVLSFFYSFGFFITATLLFLSIWGGWVLLREGEEGSPGELWAGAVIILLVSLFTLSPDEKTPLLIVFAVNTVCGIIFYMTEGEESIQSTQYRHKPEVWEVKRIRRIQRRR